MLRLSVSQVVPFVPGHCKALLGLRYWDESPLTPEPAQEFSLLTESLMRTCLFFYRGDKGNIIDLMSKLLFSG